MIDHAGSENAAANQKVIKSYYDFGKAVSECHNYYIREKKKWIPAAQRLVKEEIRKQIPMKITVDFKPYCASCDLEVSFPEIFIELTIFAFEKKIRKLIATLFLFGANVPAHAENITSQIRERFNVICL
ncbi:13182_t:CDS:2 [Entrophospora sp. SA101]|nr:13182_t:CDS:2 [Entrophospora sp. SA101]